MNSHRYLALMELKYTRALLPGMFLDFDCVIIPGLGGFVCNERAAWFDEDKSEMVPPSRDVLFNPNLIHNDGLLAQEVIRATDFSYAHAMKIVEEEAGYISEQLKGGKSIEIPKVGRLYTMEDEIIRFTPNSELVRVLSSFGHSRIPLQKLEIDSPVIANSKEAIVSNNPNKIKEDSTLTKVIQIRRRLARLAAVLAIPLAIGSAWLISDTSTKSTLLSIFPSLNTEAIISSFSPRTSSRESSTNSALATLAPSEESSNDLSDIIIFEPEVEVIAEEVVVEEVIVEEVIVEETVETEIAISESTTKEVNFLMVIGAFSIESNATRFAAKMSSEGYEITRHFQSHNKLHLVVMGEFEREDEARVVMAEAKKNHRIKSWLKDL